VTGFRDAVVSLPIGATEPRRSVVALHGNFDRPEWQCDVWRGVAGATPFILCPRGVPRTDVPPSEDRYTYTTLRATFDEVDAAKRALDQRFGRYVSTDPAVLVAFSLGAIYAAREIVERPAAFPVVVLVEGGYEGWTSSRARKYAEGGGRRVLFACAQTVCRNAARAAVPLFVKHGADARFAYAAGAGHTYDGEVAKAVAAEWGWIVGADRARAGRRANP
jgi:hypothetical protein